MDIRARPVKQVIICDCDSKFENEPDLKVHLDVFHKGDTEVRVRVQKVYLNSPPNPASQIPKNETPKKPTSLWKSAQNTNVEQNTIRKQNTNVQGNNTFVSKQNTNIEEQNSILQKNTNVQERNTFVRTQNKYEPNTFESKALVYIENGIQGTRFKTMNGIKSSKIVLNTNKVIPKSTIYLQYPSTMAKSQNPIVINKKSIIPNTGSNRFAIFKTGDNKFIVKNNMFNTNEIQIPVRDNVQVPTTAKFYVQSTPKHVQAATKNVHAATPKYVQVASAASVIVQNTPIVVQATPKRLPPQATGNKAQKPIILPNGCSTLMVHNNSVNTAEPMYLVSGKPSKETYQQVIVQEVGEESQESPKKEEPVVHQGVYKFDAIHDTAYEMEVGDDGYAEEVVQDGNDITEDGNDDAGGMDLVINSNVQDTEYQTMNGDVLEQEIIHHDSEIVVEGNEIIVEGNDIIVNDVKSEVEVESEFEVNSQVDVEESTNCKDEMDGNDYVIQVVTGPSTIVVNKKNSQEEFHYCDLCGKTFEKERSLRYHKTRYHKIKSQASTLFPCSLCDRGFKSEKSLHMHRTKVHGMEPQRSKKREGGFPCTVCEKVLTSKYTLQYHERLHTGEKPYKCKYCDKTFVTKCNIGDHVRTHTKERPFRCDVCQTPFRKKANMTRHRRIVHSGLQPYTCKKCDKRFSQVKSMKLHVLTVHLKQLTPLKSQNRAAVKKREIRERRKALALTKQDATPITISQIPLYMPPGEVEDIVQQEEVG